MHKQHCLLVGGWVLKMTFAAHNHTKSDERKADRER
jgi:hypothetical protein